MDIVSHPATVEAAKQFIAPGSLSYPTAVGDVVQDNGQKPTGQVGTPAATPAAPGASGITPVLQNIVATVNLDCRLDLKTIALHVSQSCISQKAVQMHGPVCAYSFVRSRIVLTNASYLGQKRRVQSETFCRENHLTRLPDDN